VIYRRRVVGVRGECNAYKFRSMRTDADTLLHADPGLRAIFERNFKLKSDPRVTRVGAALRRYSLDELPQLWNVVKGEMSLVGPRMVTAAELPKYGPQPKATADGKAWLDRVLAGPWSPGSVLRTARCHGHVLH
jgi:lipopolysaccharide/colanic/teichoic acid biosynthesis glycosyltransferase